VGEGIRLHVLESSSNLGTGILSCFSLETKSLSAKVRGATLGSVCSFSLFLTLYFAFGFVSFPLRLLTCVVSMAECRVVVSPLDFSSSASLASSLPTLSTILF
jgi:hypothetical protein